MEIGTMCIWEYGLISKYVVSVWFADVKINLFTKTYLLFSLVSVGAT